MSVPEEQATERLAEIMRRIKELGGGNLEPPQFFANFLQLAVAGTGSRGGAIWLAQGAQESQVYCHIDIELCGIKESATQGQLVLQAVGRTVEEGKPLVLPPAGAEGASVEGAGAVGQNQCGRALFFRPLRAANQVAMVLQLIGSEQITAHDYRAVVALASQMAEGAETYLAHRRASVLEDDRKALARLLQYAEAVHGTLDAEKVIYEVANRGREVIGCTRAMVWVDPKVKRGLLAVSGVDRPDRRAVLMQAVKKLAKQCLDEQKAIVASREQLVELDEGEALTGLLRDYFNVSKLDAVYLQPMKQGDTYLGVLIAEGFEEPSGVNVSGVVAAVANHGAVALSNALVSGRRRKGKAGALRQDKGRRRKWVLGGLAAAVLVAVAAVAPWPVKVEGPCTLTPRVRRVVDAPVDGVAIVEIVRASGVVEQGEVIARLDDADLRADRAAQQADKGKAAAQLEQASRKGQTGEMDYYQHEIKKLEAQIALLDLLIERCEVRAPISGTILTPQLELKEDATVRKGDLICEIADLQKWEVVVEAPQKEIGWVHRGLAAMDETAGEGAAEGLPTEFYLAAYPEHKLLAWVKDAGQISQMPRVGKEGNYYEVRAPVEGQQLGALAAMGLRDGSTGRAKVATVDRRLGYVLLRKVIRFFRVTFF